MEIILSFVIVFGLITLVPFVIGYFGGIGLWCAKRVVRPDPPIQINIDGESFEEADHGTDR